MSPASSLLQGLSEEAVWRLEAACCRFEQAWLAGPRPAPWDFLDGTSDAERPAVLRELLRLDVFYRRRAGEVPSPADYPARLTGDELVVREALADSSEAADATVDDLVNRPREPGAVEPPANGDAPPGADGCLGGRYRLLRFHAQGGLGEVHVAEDAELGREVALKQMQAEHAADPDRRSRFVSEGEITGGLEHPGVVPVYGRGARGDGRPFYTMRFIRGETLADAISRFHAQKPARFDSMEFRQLLGRFAAVCQAVAYAHSRGVLHRDLKPANVMLGPFGETLVLDWGLAKVLGEAEAGAAAEAPLRLKGPGGAATLGVVGTPAYMSPEQAAGRAEELGPATDVYGLGATLYEMLTGAAPFQGNLFEVLTNVAAGAWTPPGQVNRAVPPALDAVCRKAMALRREDRYASALDLAKDLEAWLADEPVSAYPEPVGTRLRRWARKHPRKVTGAVVLLATAVIGLTLGTVLLERSKRQAEDSYQRAREVVNYFLREVSEDILLDEPDTQPLRHSLLNKALHDYEKILKIRSEDADARQQLAETYRLRGGLEGEVGGLGEAKSCLDRAVDLYEGLARAKPADTNLRLGLARCRLWQAELQVRCDEPEAAAGTVGEAIELLTALRDEERGRPDVHHLLSRCHDLRATAQAQAGDAESALRDNRESLNALEKASMPVRNAMLTVTRGGAPAAFGTETAFRREPISSRQGFSHGTLDDAMRSAALLVAPILANKGTLLATSGCAAESAQSFQEAADHWAWLSERRPRSGRLRHGLALALLGAGRADVELGRPAAAEPTLRKAVALLEKVAEQDPLVPEYKRSLVRARGSLGECLLARGRHQPAAELLRDVVKSGEELLQEKGRGRALLADYPRFLHSLGRVQAALGHRDEALRCCARAMQMQEQALASAPNNPALRNDLLRSRETLSGLRLLTREIGRDDRLREQWQIVRERRALAGRDSSPPCWRSEASASAAVLAGLLLRAGRPHEALEIVEQALPPHEVLLRTDLRRWLEGEGRTLSVAGDSPLRWVTGIGPSTTLSVE